MKKKLTYKQAGVDIGKANRLVRDIKKLTNATRIKGSVGSIGGFGGFFDLSPSGAKGSLLVASTDGVGTKLKIAQDTGVHGTVGIDLVAMCVNDVLCSGARPLFFLDYFATGKLDGKIWKEVIKGITAGCKEARCALLGGETAEMPGMYDRGEYDLAGFCVGSVERKKVIDGSRIKPGDAVLGLASSGLHSNGYSLVRKVFTGKEIEKNKRLLLKPTRIYVKPVLEVSKKVPIKGIANITGGGFYDNISRILPGNARAVIKEGSWKLPGVFKLITEKADIEKKELYTTFNMGIGMVLIVPQKEVKKTITILKRKFKLESWIIGKVVKGKKGVEIT
ncbi:MAG: phosphoribosylformylglycinamidine cyclo-ligase [Candidatus Omnitrophota bacterium]|jgi:phosphoribosylformylglycinamidine cyclo-ligase